MDLLRGGLDIASRIRGGGLVVVVVSVMLGAVVERPPATANHVIQTHRVCGVNSSNETSTALEQTLLQLGRSQPSYQRSHLLVRTYRCPFYLSLKRT